MSNLNKFSAGYCLYIFRKHLGVLRTTGFHCHRSTSSNSNLINPALFLCSMFYIPFTHSSSGYSMATWDAKCLAPLFIGVLWDHLMVTMPALCFLSTLHQPFRPALSDLQALSHIRLFRSLFACPQWPCRIVLVVWQPPRLPELAVALGLGGGDGDTHPESKSLQLPKCLPPPSCPSGTTPRTRSGPFLAVCRRDASRARRLQPAPMAIAYP